MNDEQLLVIMVCLLLSRKSDPVAIPSVAQIQEALRTAKYILAEIVVPKEWPTL